MSFSHVVSLVRCGTWFYRFLIFAAFNIYKYDTFHTEMSFIVFGPGFLRVTDSENSDQALCTPSLI